MGAWFHKMMIYDNSCQPDYGFMHACVIMDSLFLQSLVRGGITVSVTLNYRLEPSASAKTCTAYCSLSPRTCIGLYDSFPNNNIRLDAWYQSRRV